MPENPAHVHSLNGPASMVATSPTATIGSTTGYRRDQYSDASGGVEQPPVSSSTDFPTFGAGGDAAVATEATTSAASGFSADGTLVTTCSSLAIVLGLFAVLVYAWRRGTAGRSGAGVLPTEAVRPVGSTMLDTKNRLTLLKVGRRAVLVCSGVNGGPVSSICQIDDLDEANELLAMCDPKTRQTFQQTMRQIEREPARGFVQPTSPRGASTWSAAA